MARERRATTGFCLGLIALACFKLWIVHGEDIVGSATQYDALWFVRSASHWYWQSPYSWTAFVRPCAYPLFVAVVHLLHVPLRLAIEVLQIGAALALVCALRRAGLSRIFAAFCFAAMLLHPIGFQLNDYTMADTLYAALLPLVVALLLVSMETRKHAPAISAGIAIAVLWNTREEGVLLLALLFVWALLMLLRGRRSLGRWGAAFRQVAQAGGVIVAVAAGLITIAYTANYVRIRSFARSEMTARSFETLFNALLRIQPAERKRYVPITTDTLERAFRVSPTFATVQSEFEGRLGESWRVETKRQVGVPGEIGVGWIVWATRQAAAEKGVFASPDKAQRFFKKAAREINEARRDGRLASRFVLGGFLDPLAQTGAKYLPQSFVRIGARWFARWDIKPIPDDEVLRPEEAALYDRMTGRRPVSESRSRGAGAAVEQWLGTHHYLFAIALHLAALLSLVWLFVCRPRPVMLGGVGGAIVLLAAAVFLRVALFAWLDTTAFDSTGDRFLFPVMPLWSVTLLVLIGRAWRLRAERVVLSS